MPNMSQGDALTLSGYYATCAEQVMEYQTDHGADPDVDQVQLSTLVSSLTQHSRDLTNDALATSFDDSVAAVQQLQQATLAAGNALAELKHEVASYTRVVAIAAGVISVGVGLASNNPLAAIKAAVSLAGTVAKNADS